MHSGPSRELFLQVQTSVHSEAGLAVIREVSTSCARRSPWHQNCGVGLQAGEMQ